MPIIRKRLSEDEFSNPALRYDETCDCVQFSPDGGATWVDQPANDPRRSDAYRLPPLTGSDVRCRAAEGMRAYIQSVVDQSLDAEGYVELAGLIIGFAVFIPGFPVLWAIILAVAFAIFTLGAGAIEAAMTEGVYDEIRCIFYCNIDDDGMMDADGYDRAYEQLIDLDTIPRTIVQKCMEMIGYVGLSNAGVALEGAADCDCECEWCYEEDLLVSDCGYSNASGAVWTSGQGWEATDVYVGGDPSRPRRQAFISKSLPGTMHITKIELQFVRELGNQSAVSASVIANSTFSVFWLNYGTSSSPVECFPGDDLADIAFSCAASGCDGCGDPGGFARMTKVIWHGTGDCLFGEPNC